MAEEAVQDTYDSSDVVVKTEQEGAFVDVVEDPSTGIAASAYAESSEQQHDGQDGGQHDLQDLREDGRDDEAHESSQDGHDMQDPQPLEAQAEAQSEGHNEDVAPAHVNGETDDKEQEEPSDENKAGSADTNGTATSEEKTL